VVPRSHSANAKSGNPATWAPRDKHGRFVSLATYRGPVPKKVAAAVKAAVKAAKARAEQEQRARALATAHAAQARRAQAAERLRAINAQRRLEREALAYAERITAQAQRDESERLRRQREVARAEADRQKRLEAAGVTRPGPAPALPPEPAAPLPPGPAAPAPGAPTEPPEKKPRGTPGPPGETKAERKKRLRKERKAREDAFLAEQARTREVLEARRREAARIAAEAEAERRRQADQAAVDQVDRDRARFERPREEPGGMRLEPGEVPTPEQVEAASGAIVRPEEILEMILREVRDAALMAGTMERFPAQDVLTRDSRSGSLGQAVPVARMLHEDGLAEDLAAVVQDVAEQVTGIDGADTKVYVSLALTECRATDDFVGSLDRIIASGQTGTVFQSWQGIRGMRSPRALAAAMMQLVARLRAENPRAVVLVEGIFIRGYAPRPRQG
jgi:hypothetical protein